MDNFNLKKFLTENKLTTGSKRLALLGEQEDRLTAYDAMEEFPLEYENFVEMYTNNFINSGEEYESEEEIEDNARDYFLSHNYEEAVELLNDFK